jgi:hypothetical protein
MQKISGILGPSARVTSVDMKDAPPVRPGMPGFGRAEGVSSLRQRNQEVDALVRAPQLLQQQFDLRTKEGQHAKMVNQVSESFFMKNNRDATITQPGQKTESGEEMVDVMVAIPLQIAASELEPVASKPAQADYDSVSAAAKESSAPEGLYPKGSFVDVVA